MEDYRRSFVCMRVARFTGVVPLLLLPLLCRCCTARMFLKFRGSVGWNCPLCSGWHSHIIRAHRSTIRNLHTTNTISYLSLLLHRGFHNVKRSRCDISTQQQHTAYQVPGSKNKKSQVNAECQVCSCDCVRGSYCCRILR